MTTDLGLIPLRNFGIIDQSKGMYRSAQPEYEFDYTWLKEKLGVDLVFNLRKEADADRSMCKQCGIEVTDILVPDHEAPSVEQADTFIDFVKAVNKPLLIHCEHGHGRTSTFSVLLKLGIGFTLDDAVKDEEVRFQYVFKYPVQADFLKSYYEHFKLRQ